MKTKNNLPNWFNGTIYHEGSEVQNRFSGDSCYLNKYELSMYDFVIGASTCYDLGIPVNVDELRKGLDWFKQHNPSAYMILLD